MCEVLMLVVDWRVGESSFSVHPVDDGVNAAETTDAVHSTFIFDEPPLCFFSLRFISFNGFNGGAEHLVELHLKNRFLWKCAQT